MNFGGRGDALYMLHFTYQLLPAEKVRLSNTYSLIASLKGNCPLDDAVSFTVGRLRSVS